MGSHPILGYCRRRRPSFLLVAWLMSATLLWLCAPAGISNANAAAFVQVSGAAPQTNQSQVSVTYTQAQVAGDANIVAISWKNATLNITSVIDSAGNTYQLAVPTARGTSLSQAIYYAKNINAAAAGANTVTVTLNAAAPYVHVRALEYSGLDPTNPLDVGGSAKGTQRDAEQRVRHRDRRSRAGLWCRPDARNVYDAENQLHQSHHTDIRNGRGHVCDGDGKLQRNTNA